jgi:hypothetical protein
MNPTQYVRMTLRIRFCRWLLIGSAIFGGRLAAVEPADTLQRHLDRFPRVTLGKDERNQARIALLDAPQSPLAINGFYYHGFRFTVPDWIDAPMVWMLVTPQPFIFKEGEFSSFITPVEGRADFSLPLTNFPIRPFESLATRFPKAESFFQQEISKESLVPGREYLICYRFTKTGLPKVAVAFTVSSDRGLRELGGLPIGPPRFRAPPLRPGVSPKGAATIAADAAGEFKTNGSAAALRLLDRSGEDFLGAGGSLSNLRSEIWREAQFSSGRENAAWAADLYDWLFRRALSCGDEVEAAYLIHNFLEELANAGRYGRLKEIINWQERVFWRSGYELDPTSYPDAGPGFASLPEVRRRNIPFIPPLGIPSYGPGGLAQLYRTFERLQAAAVNSMADDREQSGRWREALEWRLWTQAWALQQTPDRESGNVWFRSALGNALNLESLSLFEAARQEHERIASHAREDGYSGRTKIESRLGQINCALQLGAYRPEMEIQARDLAEQVHRNINMTKVSRLAADLIHARCLIAAGNVAAGLAKIDTIIAAGYEDARFERCVRRLAGGKLEGIEADLILLLESYRSSGRKIKEANLYSLYAGFLEASGRYAEAIAMRREAVRLMRSFDLFATLPVELARLALLLHRSGDLTAAAAATTEAANLAGRKNRIPARIAAQVAQLLAARPPVIVAKKPDPPKTTVDLQPIRALIIPLEGHPLRGRLTLVNPTPRAVEGTLAFEGLPAHAVWNAATGNATVTLGKGGSIRLSNVRLESGGEALIELFAPSSVAAKGKLTVVWSVPGQPDLRSVWSLEDAENGVSSAVIDAGEFRGNPFYGVLIHHHYMQAARDAPRVNFRVTASAPIRMELYDDAGHPVFVDATGDGSLGGVGDSLFTDTDGDGAGDLLATKGEAPFGLLVYPPAKIPAEGIRLRVEVKVGAQWVVFAEDRIIP